jgi:hypothetical protein
MKAIPTTPAVKKSDAALDAKLNPVELANNEIVAWGIAFPRPGQGTTLRVAATVASSSARTLNPVWRTDATLGSVLGALGRLPTVPSGD